MDVLTDILQYSGQVAYLRDLLKGKDWIDVRLPCLVATLSP